MPDLSAIIQNGAANPWLYLPAAVILGALHALEPGHSKSLMAAFIVAIRGTARQAVLLGISAAVGHTIIVWGLAVLGLYLGDRLILDRAEPWLVLVSGLLIILLALRLIWAVHRSVAHHEHDHDHDHQHAANHDHDHGHAHHHAPHHDAGHGHDDAGVDAHARAHARQIGARFAGRRQITNWEIAWFGFTGGLLPCPAAIAVLLICLQLKAFTLGVSMVAAFSIGLAITLVSIGVVAAWGTRRVARSWAGFDALAGRLPYISAAIVMIAGFLITLSGLSDLGVFGPA